VIKFSPEGEILFSWSASQFLPFSELDPKDYELEFPLGKFQDPFHCNSVQPLGDSQFIVSLRNTNSIYLINMKSGKVIWKIGGNYWKNISLPIMNASQLGGFSVKAQHDFRFWGENTFSFFDNQTDNRNASRGIVFKLLKSKSEKYSYKILRVLKNPEGQNSKCMGSVRKIQTGWVVGWGCSNLGATLFGFDGNPIVSIGLNNEFNRNEVWKGVVSPEGENDLNSRFYTMMSYRFETKDF
jgi:hypothetical protein